MIQPHSDQIDQNADLILHAGNALQTIAQLVAQSDIAEEGYGVITQDHRVNLMWAVEIIGESLVRRSMVLRQIGQER
ncbi:MULTISPECIES: hypothetical protein [unclassified Pseudomonas]|uniref:hypothetical protein n=1 Tax=unclassified Pseudomonas TaxID=196821 RepID=UPI001C60BA7F|nr:MULTISPECIES: hypothetical protein [unclassified Pseudomonas]MBW5416088.1 hypothetical protein [Pseudomonas sp. MAG002Y]